MDGGGGGGEERHRRQRYRPGWAPAPGCRLAGAGGGYVAFRWVGAAIAWSCRYGCWRRRQARCWPTPSTTPPSSPITSNGPASWPPPATGTGIWPPWRPWV